MKRLEVNKIKSPCFVKELYLSDQYIWVVHNVSLRFASSSDLSECYKSLSGIHKPPTNLPLQKEFLKTAVIIY